MPDSASPLASLALESYQRYEQWLRQQNSLFPEFFRCGLVASDSPKHSETAKCDESTDPSALTLVSNPDGSASLRLGDFSLFICDGCAALVRFESVSESLHHECPHCGFCTILFGPRRLLGLGPYAAGLEMPLSAARALLVEALGPQLAYKQIRSTEWLHNVAKRRLALQLLLHIVGFIHEEDWMVMTALPTTTDRTSPAIPAPPPPHIQNKRARALRTNLHALREGEQCLDAILQYLPPPDTTIPVYRVPPVASRLSTPVMQANNLPSPADLRKRRLAVIAAPVIWANTMDSLAQSEAAVTELSFKSTGRIQDLSDLSPRSSEIVRTALALYKTLCSDHDSSKRCSMKLQLSQIGQQLRDLRRQARLRTGPHALLRDGH